MTDQKNELKTKEDYLQGFADCIVDSPQITFVTFRLRQFMEKHGLVQDELIRMLGTDQEGFVNLALCLEPADPSIDDYAPLKQISTWTGISFDRLTLLWDAEVDIEEVYRELQND